MGKSLRQNDSTPRRAETGSIHYLPDSACGTAHGFSVPGGVFSYSYKDQLLPDDLLGSGADIVHVLHPFHWVTGFQGLVISSSDR